MKRYVRSSTQVNASSVKIVPEQVISGITIRIHPFLVEQSDFDEWLEDASNYELLQDFVAGALNCAIEASGDDRDSYDYYLNTLVRLKKHIPGEGSTAQDERYITCSFGSNRVQPKWYSSGRGGHSSEARTYLMLADPSEHSWSYFLKNCKRLVREVHREYSKLQKSQNVLKDVPGNIVRSLYDFKYWIVKEKLGGNEVDAAGEEWLLSRTYDNQRSSYYQKKEILDQINELFDWLIDNNCSYADLKQLANAATTYALRSPHRTVFDYDSLTNQ